MNGSILSLYLPCEVLHVRALVAPAKSMLPLESLVLETIAKRSRAPTLIELTEMFGIGARPMLNLVQRLWNGGALTVDPEDGRIQLTRAAKAKVLQGLGSDLVTKAWSEERVTVFRDLLTGHVVRPQRSSRSRPGYTVPPTLAPSGGRLSAIECADLMEVVRGLLRRSFALQEQTLVDAIPVTLEANTWPEQREIHIRARVARDPVTDALTFRVLGPQRLPALVRADMGIRLARVAAANADLFVFKNVRRRTPGETAPTLDPLEASLARLRELVEELPKLEPVRIAEADHQCREASSDLRDCLGLALATPQSASVIMGPKAFADEVRAAIRTATEQVVLVCPFGAWDGLAQYQNELSAAVRERGIRVVIVWGIEAEDAFLRGTMQLAKGAISGSVRRSTQPARVHAKVVIRDSDLALVGSVNFLGKLSDAIEVGVRVESAIPRVPSRVPLDLLRWVKECTPDYDVRHSVSIPESTQWDPEALADPPRLHVSSSEEALLAPGVPQVRARWVEQWRAWLSEADTYAVAARRVPVLVYDEQHRDHMLRAIRTARWRLLITSDSLSETVLDANLERELRSRLEAGVPTALVWRRSPDVSQPEALFTRLAAIANDFPTNLWLVRDRNTHAKLVVADEHALVSSFNFLSFQGHFVGRRASHRAREIGVLIREPELTDHLVGEFAKHFDGALSRWQASSVRPAVDLSQQEMASATVEDLATVAGAVRPEVRMVLDAVRAAGTLDGSRQVLRMYFATTVDPGNSLAALIRTGELAPEQIDQAILCALLRPESRTRPEAHQWMRRAATVMWNQQRFFDAAVLQLASGTYEAHLDEGMPSEAVTLLAAVSHQEVPFVLRLAAISSTQLTPDDVSATCALAIHALCSHGWGEIAEHLTSFKDSGVLGARLADAVLRSWWEQSMAPLPLSAIDDIGRADRGARNRATLRDALLTKLQQGAQLPRFRKFPLGDRTLELIFGRDGVFAELWQAAKEDDPRGVASWLDQQGTAEDVVMDAWRKVRERAMRLEGNFRLAIIRFTASALDAARDWCAATSGHTTPLSSHEIRALLSLRDRLSPIWPEVTARVHADDGERRGSDVPIRMCHKLLEGLMALSRTA